VRTKTIKQAAEYLDRIGSIFKKQNYPTSILGDACTEFTSSRKVKEGKARKLWE